MMYNGWWRFKIKNWPGGDLTTLSRQHGGISGVLGKLLGLGPGEQSDIQHIQHGGIYNIYNMVIYNMVEYMRVCWENVAKIIQVCQGDLGSCRYRCLIRLNSR